MTLALANLDIALLIVFGWVALAFLTAPVVGKAIRNAQADDADLEDFIAERRAAEARAMAAARRSRERREQNLTADKRAAAPRQRPAA